MKRLLFFSLLISFPFFSFSQTKFDIILKNGRIIDGSGNPWFFGDIGIKKGKITAIGNLSSEKADRLIDVKNKIIAPGFIDVHTHIEDDEKTTPTADNLIYDGVTSVITGNCGSSKTDIKAYFNFISKLKISVNIGTLLGQGSIREKVMGVENRVPTPKEQLEMEQLVAKGMTDGAMGLSTGLIYIPGTYASTEEIVDLAKVVKQYGGLYSTHMRNETTKVFEAIEEAINIGKQANIPVEISHLKVGRPNWNRSAEALAMIDKARMEGYDVTCDQYPYSASSTSLTAIIPGWSLIKKDSTYKDRVKDPLARKKIVDEMLGDAAKRGNTDFTYAVVANCNSDSSLNGKNISEINKQRGKESNLEAEINTIIDLAAQGGAQMVYHGLNEADIENIMKYPYTMVVSDGSIRDFGKGMPHPRSYGSNARVLARYVREKQVIRLEDAIRRMTSLPAQKFKISNKGLLRPGMDADIVVFDENTVEDLSTYEHPHAFSKGFEYVLVNGVLTVSEGKHTGARAGKVIYGPGTSKQ